MVGNLLTLTDPVSNATSWVYDGLDRVTTETNELAHARTFKYDAVDNLIEKIDRNGRKTQYDYDNLHRQTDETWIDVPAPEPNVAISTTTQGDVSDEVQTVGVAVSGMGFIGGTFTLTYDGQTTGQIAYNATAATVQSALEALSNIAPGDVAVTKLTDTTMSQSWRLTFGGNLAETNVSQTTIDTTNVSVMGSKINEQGTMTQGGVVTYEVQVTNITNANAGTYTLSFQEQTTAAIAWDADAAAIDTAMEALSTIDTVTVSGSSGCYTITFTGTHSGENVPQLTGDASLLENHQNRALTFEYDAASQLTAAADPAAAYAYVYDNLGRVTQQTQDIAGLTPQIVFNQKFDAASNRTELNAVIGANNDFKNTYAYDALNRMTQVIQQGNGGNAVAAKRIDLSYNAAGQFDVITRYQSTDTTNPVATSHFTYDGMGRLSSLDHKTAAGSTTLAGYDYTYDAASRITSIDSLIDGLSQFTYDVTNQLTAADHASQPDETYSFDLNGNRTMTGHTVGDNNQLSTDGTYNYTYDNEGNLASRTKISDGTSEEYEWDWRNRLVGVTFKNGSGTTTKTLANSYDVFNRWVRRTVDADGPGGAAATDTFFAYDGYNPVLQFDGPSDSDLSNRNLFGPAVDQILAVEDVTSLTSAGNTLWGLTDHLGTPRDVADLNEGNGTTAVTNHRTYNSFGTQLSETNADVDFIFGETGKMLDEHTLANWHLHRWTRDGRWLSQDPIGFSAGDTNLTRLVHNDPVNFIDPDGLQGAGHHVGPKQGNNEDPNIYDPSRRPGQFREILGPDGAARNSGTAPVIEGMQQRIEYGKGIARDGQRLMADVGGFGEVLDASEAATGTDLLDENGRKLSMSERAWRCVSAGASAAAGAIAGILGRGSKGAKKANGAAGEAAAEAADAGRSARRGTGAASPPVTQPNRVGVTPPTQPPKKQPPAPKPPETGTPVKPKPGKPGTPSQGGPYSGIKDGTKIEPGRLFQPGQKDKILTENGATNGGKLRSDDPRDPLYGQDLEPPPKGPFKPGEFPPVPDNQAQVDHIVPRIGPDGKPLGTNDYCNAQVVSALWNRMKRNKVTE